MRDYGWYVAIFVGFCLLAVGGNFACAGIPSEGRAVQAVENLGYREVRVESRQPSFGVLRGCHEKDVTLFRVSGVAPTGERRWVEVCAPVLGGYTIRT